jgi:hypothetical protein
MNDTTPPRAAIAIPQFLDKRPVQWTLGLLTFAFVFIYHTFPLGLSDFWWHLNTARWIWEHASMPVTDPFLYSSPVPLDGRASLILRGYPLSQLLMLGIYNLGGIYALVLLKGVLMTVFYALLWNQLRRSGLHPVLALAAVAPLPLLFFRFDELRPQIFSFIGTLLLLQMTEALLQRERQGRAATWPMLAAFPATMLLWANLHRGFIIGVGMLFCYLLAEWIARRRKVDALPDGALRRFLVLVLVSMGVSFVNPVGVTALWASFTEVSGPFSAVVDEFFGTLRYFEFHGMPQMGYIVVALAVVPSLAVLLKWKRLSIAHGLILAAFVAAGILSFRFSLMMVALALAIACIYFARELNRRLLGGKGAVAVLLWCVATGGLANSAIDRTALFKAPLEQGVIPVSAVDYLAQTPIVGNIYNSFENGGYLSWRLYPRQFFIDPRNLSWGVYEEYSRAWRGDYEALFNKYQIGAVFYPVYSNGDKPSNLVVKLFKDNRWAVGYYDGANVVFIRYDMNSQLPFLNKRQVGEDILRQMRGGL